MRKDYKIYEDEQQVIVEGVKDFNLSHIFECGQCFRWNKEEDGSYTGVAFGKVINIWMQQDRLTINNANLEEFEGVWRKYFDLDRDYSMIKGELSKDKILHQAVQFGWGMRILKQELWECLISFIISSNNTISRIKKIIQSISEKYGQPIYFGNKVYYSFPQPEDLYKKTLEDMAFCKSGYRCKYILNAAKAVIEFQVVLNALEGLETIKIREELMKIQGIGPKVADCILLFSLQRYDVFPTDVWVRRVMGYFYLGSDPAIKEVHRYSDEHFGNLAGFAQQYLFYYAREMKIGK
ncbi:MAG: DNA-3-methyladenine glycosylase [Clostridia bacterium]